MKIFVIRFTLSTDMCYKGAHPVPTSFKKKQGFESIRPFLGDNEIKRKKKSIYLCQFGAPLGQSLGLLSQLPNIATV